MCVVTEFFKHIIATIQVWIHIAMHRVHNLGHHIKHEFSNLTGIHGCPFRWAAKKLHEEPELEVGLGLAGNFLITAAIIGLGFFDVKLGEMNSANVVAIYN